MNMEEKMDKLLAVVITMQQDISEIKDRMTNMEGEMTSLKGEVKELRKDVYALNDDVGFLVKKTLDNGNEIRVMRLAKEKYSLV